VTSLGEKVKVNIWDCAGTRSYERLVAIHIQRSDSILVFYSPYKKESFEEASISDIICRGVVTTD
jgi:GTPase SAR1 family protein